MIRIYSYSDSSNALKPRFLLEEAGVAYETVKVDLAAGENRKPEFLEINPFGVIPVVEIDGERFYESNAILRYLARRYHPTLYKIGNAARCQRIDMWMDLLSTGYRPRIIPWEQATVLRERAGASAPTPEQAAAHRDRALAFLACCERFHAGSPWCIEEFTIADIAWASSLERIRRTGLEISSMPKIAAWIDAVLARPAFSRARVRD